MPLVSFKVLHSTVGVSMLSCRAGLLIYLQHLKTGISKLVFYSPYYYAAVDGDSATMSGLQLLPLLLGLVIFSVVSLFSLPLVSVGKNQH